MVIFTPYCLRGEIPNSFPLGSHLGILSLKKGAVSCLGSHLGIVYFLKKVTTI
jgi:hypothetical protein